MRLKFFEVDQALEMLRVPLVTILARENAIEIFWSRPSFGDVVSGASHDIGARNAIEIFWSRPSFGDVASAASHDIGARNAIEIVWSRPTFGDVVSGASHDIGARNAIEIFWSRPSFGDVASAAGHNIGARKAIEIFWSRPTFGDVASGASHDIGARNAIEIFRSRPTFGDVASGASHDIGARNAIESFCNYIWCQTANNVTSRARKISLKFVEKMSIFNRIYRANIVTSGPRSTSKACFVKKLSIAFLAPTSWFAALAPHSLRGLHVSIAYPAPISWQKRPCSQSHVKHVSVSTAAWWHSRQVIVDIMRLS